MTKLERLKGFLDWVAHGKLIIELGFAIAGAKATKAFLASFTDIPEIWRSPIEWFIGAIILGVLLYVSRNWGGRPAATTPETPAVQPYIAPPWERAGYQSEEIWRAAVAAQNKLIELGRSVEGLFRPLQIDAFRLAQQMRGFLETLGPRPDVDWTGAKTSEEVAERLSRRRAAQVPWESQLVNGYRLRFSEEVRKIMLRLGEAGVENSLKLQPYIDEVRWERNIEEAARTVESLAIAIDNVPFGDSGKDTRSKVDRMTSEDFKKLVGNPEMALWIGTQIDRGE
jgi:hypothetical protein